MHSFQMIVFNMNKHEDLDLAILTVLLKGRMPAARTMQSLYNPVWVHKMDCVTSEPCHKGTILHRNYRKMTIKWSFSYNFFVIFYGKKWTHNMTVLYPNLCYNEEYYKGASPYL